MSPPLPLSQCSTRGCCGPRSLRGHGSVRRWAGWREGLDTRFEALRVEQWFVRWAGWMETGSATCAALLMPGFVAAAGGRAKGASWQQQGAGRRGEHTKSGPLHPPFKPQKHTGTLPSNLTSTRAPSLQTSQAHGHPPFKPHKYTGTLPSNLTSTRAPSLPTSQAHGHQCKSHTLHT